MFKRLPRFWPRTSAPAREKMRGWSLAGLWGTRVEQRGGIFSSSTPPPGLVQSSIKGAMGEEGLGFWALKSERERLNNRGRGLTIGGLVMVGARNIGRGLNRTTSLFGLWGLGWQQPGGRMGLVDRTSHRWHLKANFLSPPSRRRTQYRCRRPCCCTPCQSRCTRSPSCTQTRICGEGRGEGFKIIGLFNLVNLIREL